MIVYAQGYHKPVVADNRHSRFVNAAKIIFPLVALGLLSTIFLLSRTLDPSQAIPFSDVDVQKIAKEQLLANPRFSGVTSDGTAISITAESARPDLLDPKRLSASTVTAQFKTTSGNTYDVYANDAQFDGTKELLDLSGNVQIDSSDGYHLSTENLSANLSTSGLVAPGEVFGSVPNGTITAGNMELIVHDGKQLLVFKDGVKLIYGSQ
ncbi:MAG: LPS export ABC transporter periplasmic protein LptC [Litoreibacter sp.]